MTLKGSTMKNKHKVNEPLPEMFATEEDAGEFWDTHSTMDYSNYLEPSEDKIAINQRIFEIPVEEDIYQRLQKEAKTLHQSVPKVVDEILRKTLAVT